MGKLGRVVGEEGTRSVVEVVAANSGACLRAISQSVVWASRAGALEEGKVLGGE